MNFIAHSNLYGEKVYSRLLYYTMQKDLEQLLGPSNKTNFSVHWPFALRFAVYQPKTAEFADYFGGYWRGFLDSVDPQNFI